MSFDIQLVTITPLTDQLDSAAPLIPRGDDTTDHGVENQIYKPEEGDEKKKALPSATDLMLADDDNDSEISTEFDNLSLHVAAREGAIDRVKAILTECQHKLDEVRFEEYRDRLNNEQFSALHLASRYNRKNVIVYLLDMGAQVDTPDGGDGNTPLLLAAKYDMSSSALYLISRGANIEFKNCYGTSALHFACRRANKDLCQKLLNQPAINVNETDNSMATPLHMAMMGGSTEVTQLLINAGANVHANDNEGELPIHYAAAENEGDLIVILVKGALNGVAQEDREQKQREYVNSTTDEKDTPLHVAAQGGYVDTVKTLVSLGANVNARTDTGATPLHLAAISGSKDVVNYLLLSKSKVNAFDEDQMTPLHRACQYGRLATVQLLLQRGAKLDAKDKNNFTPMMCAVWKGQLEVMKFLLNNGAKIHLVDDDDKNLLHLAIEEGHCDALELLMEHGGLNIINGKDNLYRSPIHYAAKLGDQDALEFLISKGAQVDHGDNDEKTPLHLAAQNGHLECVELLAAAAPGDIHSTDNNGLSPLHLAATYGCMKVIRFLIENGAESSSRDDKNWTPLDYATKNGFHKSMRILLDNDANVDAYDKNGCTPLHHASAAGHVKCINLLLDKDASISMRTYKGKNCLDLAIENFEKEACMAIMQHERWHEALQNLDEYEVHPIDRLIEMAPEVVEVILGKCITYSEIDKKNPDYSIKYDFRYLDGSPDNSKHANLFAPATMVKYQREKLLVHPLTVKLVTRKFDRMGRWIYLTSVTIYLLFVALLTTLVVRERMESRRRDNGSQLGSNCQKETWAVLIAWVTLGLAAFHILKELIQLLTMGWRYVKDPVNFFEFGLYLSTILFMLPFLLCQLGRGTKGTEDLKWQAGAVCVLLAWSNLLLYLKRFPYFGLYVVMFIEVLQTLFEVLLVFSILVIGFALSFYALLDMQNGFSFFGRAIVKTMVMMIGELDFNDTFAENFAKDNKHLLPYKGMTIFIFVAFIIVMLIVVMNLLVGLAVGDIEGVRKNAYLRILQSQINILRTLERNYPRFLLRKIYLASFEEMPNARTTWRKIRDKLGRFDAKTLQEEQMEMGGKEHEILREIDEQKIEMNKQKDKMKNVLTLLETQLERTKKIALKLKVKVQRD